MKDFYLYPLYWMTRFIFWLRYKIEVVGLDKVVESKKDGILFLPNHPALIDPVMVLLALWPKFRPRPLALEEYYLRFKWLLDCVNVVCIPSMDTTNKWKALQIEKAKVGIAEHLASGDNFMIYPAGRLKREAEEKIGGASFVFDLLRMKPQTPVVLVRTTGLWGSTFSCAPTKESPNLESLLFEGLKTLLKNGIFFAPRRKVLIELEWAPDSLPRGNDKMQLNKWLEDWYNKNGPEKEVYVSQLFWKKKLPEIKQPKQVKISHVATEEEKQHEILNFLAEKTHRQVSELQPSMHLSNDLGLDSLDIGQLNVFLEERFDIIPLGLGQLQTINDLFVAAEGKKEEEIQGSLEKSSMWPEEKDRLDPLIPEGKTIQEVFLYACDRMKNSVACGDRVSGVLRYRRLKMGALILAEKIKEMPGDKIGILLPSSVGAYISILATLLAGKIPVMLNWTTGFKNLEYAVDLCKIQKILSSYKFLSRADTVELGSTAGLLVLLEELRTTISLGQKLKGLFRSFLSASTLLKKLNLKTNEEDPAVIIFTSGTETLPKGVPLSHRNLLTNQKASLARVDIKAEDVFYSVLPPFHSFGFSVTGLLPLLAGIKTCFAPDPTKSRSMASDIHEWRATIFCCAPSFIKALLHVSKGAQLKSLRLVVSGAEKAPQEIFDNLKKRGIVPLEGYGISECSPVVTTDLYGKPHKGVGYPINDVKLCVIDPDTGTLLPQGKEGEVCISGPGVFNGYLGIKKDPFITLEGQRWYRSGDRGYIDVDGALILTGRMTRFVKIGGEMVSLGGLEQDLLKICHEKGWLPTQSELPQLAAGVKDREGEKPLIILFAVKDLNRDELNRALKDMGHGAIVKIYEVRKIAAVPVTATGKVKYHDLDEMIKNGA
ncbi:MAG: AMP-binding protein [Verrucomicrobia bacterium]|nr:AMP-binding protein [Verrucomicrobiota bacterium]